ncbi:hypothetical protein IZY60_02450 [Lutibacter sp. B2]|nr:hypothetical protein [Lutibacter sp. B2]
MKKTISIILVGICIIGLVGCGATNNTNTQTTESQSEQQEQENNDEKISGNPLIGKWSNVQNASEMEITEDGKLLDAGVEVATYEMTGENTVKIHNTNDEEIEITYEIDGDTLKWGTNFEQYQEFTKINSVG